MASLELKEGNFYKKEEKRRVLRVMRSQRRQIIGTIYPKTAKDPSRLMRCSALSSRSNHPPEINLQIGSHKTSDVHDLYNDDDLDDEEW